MLKEAATEILRLRAEVRLFEIVVCETAKALGVVPDNDAIIEGIESLRAENEKLRAALIDGGKWMHLKTGGVYELIGECRIEATNTLAVLYRSKKDGTIWVRPFVEFYDGRFVRAAATALKETGD